MGTKKKIIAAAAAATAIGVVASRTGREGSSETAREGTYHVVPEDEGWAVRAEGAERAASLHATKKEAVEAGRQLASGKGGSLVIHRLDGTVQRVHDYGSD